MATPPIQYMTIIEPVLEVTLLGTVITAVWQPQLQAEGLPIQSQAGKTDVIISAVASTYRGIPFKEFSLSIRVEENRYFLADAYNSNRLFAVAERWFFQTPYYHGGLVVHKQHIQLSQQQNILFEAKLPEKATVTSLINQPQELLVHLPRNLRKKATEPHFFYACLEGVGEVYSATEAMLNITPSPDKHWLSLLKESDFQIQQWLVRATARHSKSKTYTRQIPESTQP